MGVPTLPSIPLIFLLLFPLLILSAEEDKYPKNCPNTFKCGTNGQTIEFPLFNNDTHPGCGLITVGCSGILPKIYLGWSASTNYLEFEVGRPFGNQTARVSSSKLQDFIKSSSCETFDYLYPLYYPPKYISYSISPGLDLFICDTSSNSIANSSHQVFSGNYYGYRNCPGSTVYYPYRNYTIRIPEKLHRTCSHIKLPIKEGKAISDDLFSLLGNEFTLGWNVSNECADCHHSGGRCSGSSSTQVFYCANEIDAQEKGKRNLPVLLILGAAIPGAAILLFCLLVLVIRFSKYLKFKSKNDRAVEDFLLRHGSLSPKRFSYSQLKRMTNSFKTKLGQGGYGSVYRGKLNNGHDVAVKLLKEAKGSGEEFINEVATISRTSHVNIVRLLGYCFEGHKRALIYEFMPKGSLEKFICDKNSKQNKLGWNVLYEIVVGISRGLEYLHRGCNTRILHFDIKPHNILLDGDFCPKISDFGLAKRCLQNESIISLSYTRGTIGYIAPEVFCQNFGRVSHKSDVYSFGMMVMDMVGGRETNTEAEVGHTSDVYFPNWIYKKLRGNEDLGVHDITNEDANQNLRKMIIVGLWCIQSDPMHRPSMSKVVEMLEGSLEALEIPPKPYLSSPSRPISHCLTTPSNVENLFDMNSTTT